MTPVLDWNRGEVVFLDSGQVAGESSWSLIIAGDWAPTGAFGAALSANPENVYGELWPHLRSADLALFNLEGVLGDLGSMPIPKDGVHINLPAALLMGITSVPFHVACLANNHSFDWGEPGLGQMMRLLTSNGVSFVGAGLHVDAAESPYLNTIAGVRLAVLNVAEGEEAKAEDGGAGVATLDMPRLTSQLAELEGAVEIRLVVVHAGRENLPVPAPYIRSTYHALVDAGADVVIGHHPHVPQGLEIYQGKLIAYSLGNFAMYTGLPIPGHYSGYLLSLHFSEAKLQRVCMIPYRITEQGLVGLLGDERKRFFADIRNLSQHIVKAENLQHIWDAYADRWLWGVGLQDVMDSVVNLAGNARAYQSILKAQALKVHGKGLLQRLTRRALWAAHARLDKRLGRAARVTSNEEQELASKSAAILRNRFDTPAHRQLYLHALRRVMYGTVGEAPDWAYHLLDEWRV